jgi:chorismate mutase
MIESDHAEERLARVERMLAQCRRESAALKAIAASKVVVIVVDATPALDAVRPAQTARTFSAIRFDK